MQADSSKGALSVGADDTSTSSATAWLSTGVEIQGVMSMGSPVSTCDAASRFWQRLQQEWHLRVMCGPFRIAPDAL